jgi:hypothetical protein
MMAESNGNHTEELKEVVEQIAGDASEMARELRQKADDARKVMVKTLNDGALNMREQLHEAGAAEEVVKAVDDIAKGFERAAGYLNNHSVEEIRQDATKTVKENSTVILVIVLIIGVIIGLMMRGSDRD